MSIKQFEVLTEAADLLTEDDTNPEYDRAIVELSTRLLGFSDEQKEYVAGVLRNLAAIGRVTS